MEPKWVSSTWRTTDQLIPSITDPPDAVWPCSTMPAAPLTRPATTALANATPVRETNDSDVSCHSDPAPATARSPPSHGSRRKANAPTASAIAPYCTARATPKAIVVSEPALAAPASSATVFVGAAPASPMEKMNPPETGWPSAEITR